MISPMRSVIRHRSAINASRTFSASAAAREQVVGVVGEVTARARTGGFRTGILGFLLGFASASSLALYYLRQETANRSALLQESIEQLQRGTGKINSHLDRLQAVEKELEGLKAGVAGKDDVGKIRGDMRKLYDGLHLEVLDLRAHVWGVEQDLSKVVKHDSINI